MSNSFKKNSLKINLKDSLQRIERKIRKGFLKETIKETFTIVLLIAGLLLISNQALFAEDLQTMNINVDDEISFSLEENPSTGYKWHYSIGDEEIITVIDEEYVEDACPPGKLGCGGIHTWYVRGLQAGQIEIVFELYRDGSDDIIDTRKYLINVRPDIIEVEKYELFLLELPENVSTGYRWHLVNDSGILLLIDEEYRKRESSVNGEEIPIQETPAQEQPLLGAGGYRQWYLFALKKGRTTLQFELYRDKGEIVDRMVYDIIVD